MKEKKEKLFWGIYLFLGLSFLYNYMIITDFWFKYLFLVVGVFDISMVMMRSGLYNYHHGYYKHLK